MGKTRQQASMFVLTRAAQNRRVFRQGVSVARGRFSVPVLWHTGAPPGVSSSSYVQVKTGWIIV